MFGLGRFAPVKVPIPPQTGTFTALPAVTGATGTADLLGGPSLTDALPAGLTLTFLGLGIHQEGTFINMELVLTLAGSEGTAGAGVNLERDSHGPPDLTYASVLLSDSEAVVTDHAVGFAPVGNSGRSLLTIRDNGLSDFQ